MEARNEHGKSSTIMQQSAESRTSDKRTEREWEFPTGNSSLKNDIS